MNAETTAVMRPDFKKGKVKKHKRKAKKYRAVKFDKVRFFLSWGIGIVSAGIGILIIRSTKTATVTGSEPTDSASFFKWLVSVFPEPVRETLAFLMGNLFVFFGVICIIFGLKIFVRYITGRLKN